MDQTTSLKDFRRIPGVGKSIAQDFLDLGFSKVEELKGQNPDDLYEKLSLLKGCHVDRCMLYVFRCAVYFAENNDPDPELLKWWNWKYSVWIVFVDCLFLFADSFGNIIISFCFNDVRVVLKY